MWFASDAGFHELKMACRKNIIHYRKYFSFKLDAIFPVNEYPKYRFAEIQVLQ